MQSLSRAGAKSYGAKDLDRDCPDWRGPETERASESARGTKGLCLSVGGDVLRDVRWGTQKREITTGTSAPGGGHVIATDYLESEYIDLLRNASAILPHARVLADLVGDVAVPRQSGGRSAVWLSETGALGLTDISHDQVTLSPKELGAATQYTRKFLVQATPDAEMLLRSDLMQTIALGLDYGAIAGTGSNNQPTGILNTTGIGTVTASGTAVANKGSALTWADVVGLETAVASDNALMGTPRYVMHSTSRGAMKTTLRGGSASDRHIWDDSNNERPVNGYAASVSNQIPTDLTVGSGTVATAVLFGNPQDILIGLWSGIDIEIDPYTKLLNRQIRIVAFQDCDIALRHAEGWAAITGLFFGS